MFTIINRRDLVAAVRNLVCFFRNDIQITNLWHTISSFVRRLVGQYLSNVISISVFMPDLDLYRNVFIQH